MKNPKISIIVVSHDHRHFLSGCLSSILSQRGVSFETVLVDNNSRDGTVPYVKKFFPDVRIITRSARHGFASNVNVGIRQTTSPFIVVLNPDTKMQRGALQALVARMDSDKRIGICSPKLINPDGSVQMSFRRFPTWKTALFRRTPLRVFFYDHPVIKEHLNMHKSHEKAQKIDWMLGAALLLRRAMLDKIGLLDEAYRLYVEDIDICLRAHQAGWEVWYEPAARIEHRHEAKSDRRLLSIHSWYHLQSMSHFVYKFWVLDFYWNTLRLIRTLKNETGYHLRCALWKKGSRVFAATCPLCGWTGRSFKDYDCGGGNIYKNAVCPVCRAHPRHRLVYLYLKTFLKPKKPIRILHFAPEPSLERYLRKQRGTYMSADLDPKRAMRRENVEKLSFPDESFDMIICLCVLEHVQHDRAAMNEIFRVLKVGGLCIVDTPINYSQKTTREGENFQTMGERALAYWQSDHVRLYGRDFATRLASTGFKVRPLDASALVGIKRARQFGILNHVTSYSILR